MRINEGVDFYLGQNQETPSSVSTDCCTVKYPKLQKSCFSCISYKTVRRALVVFAAKERMRFTE